MPRRHDLRDADAPTVSLAVVFAVVTRLRMLLSESLDQATRIEPATCTWSSAESRVFNLQRRDKMPTCCGSGQRARRAWDSRP